MPPSGNRCRFAGAVVDVFWKDFDPLPDLTPAAGTLLCPFSAFGPMATQGR
jgi:hypothetical protein